MAKYYQISDLEALSGIKAPTIRVWEQRYSLISPARTDSKRRIYDEATVRKFLLIAQLYYSKIKISHIAKFSLEELNQRAIELVAPNPEYDIWYLELHKAVLDYDANVFYNILIECNLAFGFEITFANIILPYLHKIEVLYSLSTLTSLHRSFAFEQCHRFLFKTYNSISKYTIAEPLKKAVLFTNDEPFNILQLFFAEILFFRNNYTTIFFQNIKIQRDVLNNLDSFNASRVVTVTPISEQEIKVLMNYVEKYPKIKFYVLDVKWRLNVEKDNLYVINNLESLNEEIY